MPEPFVIGVPLGRWQTNCYIAGDRETATCVVVDPGEHGEQQVPEVLQRAGLTCEAILLTHGHLDHLWGVPGLAERLDVPVLLHPDDRWLWDQPGAAFGVSLEEVVHGLGLGEWQPPTGHLQEVRGDQRLSLAGLTFDVAHTPGHTPGHVTYLGRGLADAPVTFPLGSAEHATDDVLFSGDLLFAGSVGRTDFPRGSGEQLLASLREHVLPREDDTLVLCGHGPDTTIGAERAANPFLKQAQRA